MLTSNPNPSTAQAAKDGPGPTLTGSDPVWGGMSLPLYPALAPAAARIMIVDDEPVLVNALKAYLRESGFAQFVTTTQADEAFPLFCRQPPDVLLLDIRMPGTSGLEILRRIRTSSNLSHIPVLILTGVTDAETRREALSLGATDFLSKPIDRCDLALRVRNALLAKVHHDQLLQYSQRLERQVRMRMAELVTARKQAIRCLARAAEMRDNETGHHIVRVGQMVGILAHELGMPEEWIELVEEAATLHDVGKIGTPDGILLKPGELDPHEIEVMKNHCVLGAQLILQMSEEDWAWPSAEVVLNQPQASTSLLMNIAAQIALTHHEKWDGTGYPRGLAGEDIPLEGRLTAIADVFDALCNKRPYKPAIPLEESRLVLQQGRSSHFDPRVLDAFESRVEDMIEIQRQFAD